MDAYSVPKVLGYLFMNYKLLFKIFDISYIINTLLKFSAESWSYIFGLNSPLFKLRTNEIMCFGRCGHGCFIYGNLKINIPFGRYYNFVIYAINKINCRSVYQYRPH